MKHPKLNKQSGFSVIEIVLGAVVLVVIGAASFYVYQNYNKQSTANSTAAPSPKTDSLTAYTNKDGEFSLKYPSEWKVNTCNDFVAMALSDEGLDQVGHCAQSEGWPEIIVMTRPLNDQTKWEFDEIGWSSYVAQDITVSGVTGRRVSGTYSGEAGPYNPIVGTKTIIYTFRTPEHLYVARYEQLPSGPKSPNLSQQFDTMVKDSLKFD